MNEFERIRYCVLIIRQSPNLPKARNATFLLRSLYEQAVGYDPIDDDPTMSPIELADLADSYCDEVLGA